MLSITNLLSSHLRKGYNSTTRAVRFQNLIRVTNNELEKQTVII